MHGSNFIVCIYNSVCIFCVSLLSCFVCTCRNVARNAWFFLLRSDKRKRSYLNQVSIAVCGSSVILCRELYSEKYSTLPDPEFTLLALIREVFFDGTCSWRCIFRSVFTFVEMSYLVAASTLFWVVWSCCGPGLFFSLVSLTLYCNCFSDKQIMIMLSSLKNEAAASNAVRKQPNIRGRL